MDYNKIVEKHYPEIYESMHDMDSYHVSEYCQWFILGLDLGADTIRVLGPLKED